MSLGLDVDGYLRLDKPAQAEVHKWLADHGVPWGTCYLIEVVGEGAVDVHRYLLGLDGHKYVDPNNPHEAAHTVDRIESSVPPPHLVLR